VKTSFNVQECLHRKVKRHGTKPMHPSSWRALPSEAYAGLLVCWISYFRFCPVVVGRHRPFHPSVPWSIPSSIRPSTHPSKAKGGGGEGHRAFLNCKTPLFQGIAHSALFIACYEGVLAHNKNFSQALRKARYAISATNFFLFWVLGVMGKGRNFFFFLLGVGVLSSIHGTEETIMWQFIS
jgi:hypothetical protein